MSYQMRNTEAKIVFVHPTLLQTARKGAKAAGLPESQLYAFSDVEHKPVDEIQDWRSLLGNNAEASSYTWPRWTRSESLHQVATVNYSTGITGLPKGVMITH